MEKQKFKLNYKRTFYIGMAFFTIMMLWQVYNTYCPLFLTDYFVSTLGGQSEDHSYLVGIIMAMDNVLALFMLPLFGKLSDRTNTRLGKRMPFIIAGVALAVVLFPLIPMLFILNSYIWMIVVMAMILIAMNLYRSPAVSLMPDITPKPLRSKANAVINFVGYLGAIFAGALAIFFPAKTGDTGRLVYNADTIWIPFVITAVLMIVALVILLLKIRENKLAAELADELAEGEKQAEVESELVEDKPLSKGDKRNLAILLLSIFLWFFAFNAIETFGSLFGAERLGMDTGWWGTAVIVMTVCSLIGFFPGAWISEKLGRKWTVVLGLALMIFSLLIACFILNPWVLYVLIAIAGIGWAWVNVNSYPMVVEMASKKNVGKLTGWYYAASMLAQSLTPICVGFFFKALGFEWLFPYATIFAGIALLVFLLYKSPKKNNISTSTPESQNNIEETNE
ncbi:MAG: MFS transporter [Clostridia bacterium]|nr:MFS transporter [Clostridia bacterium]